RIYRGIEGLAVGGEILIHSERGRERGHRDEVGRRQFLIDVIVRGFDGPLDFFRLHRAEVEEHHDETAAVHVHVRRGRARRGWGWRGGGGARGGGALLEHRLLRFCRGRRLLIELFEIEAGNRLRSVVFGDREIVLRQVPNDGPALVADDDVDEDELGAGAE